MKKCIVTKERFKSARYVYKTIEKHNCSCILCVQLGCFGKCAESISREPTPQRALEVLISIQRAKGVPVNVLPQWQ